MLLAVAASAIGCSDLGTHKIQIDGNTAVTEGFATADGWTVNFQSFVVVVHDPGLIERSDNEPTWVRQNGVTVWDVVSGLPEGDEFSRQIRATRYDGADFRIAPADISEYEAVAGNAPGEIVDAAVEEGWSIHVVGSADAAMTTVHFDWTFDTNTFYRCKLDGDDAVELMADGVETSTLEILGDALFRTALGDPDAGLAFQPIADADANDDNMVTVDELEAAGLLDTLTSLTAELGGVRGAGPCPEYEAPDSE
ncbi:hypothetical protein [Enhygromyxa salina]|nr:hypothetical protein [Enhygromyxa salina]